MVTSFIFDAILALEPRYNTPSHQAHLPGFPPDDVIEYGGLDLLIYYLL